MTRGVTMTHAGLRLPPDWRCQVPAVAAERPWRLACLGLGTPSGFATRSEPSDDGSVSRRNSTTTLLHHPRSPADDIVAQPSGGRLHANLAKQPTAVGKPGAHALPWTAIAASLARGGSHGDQPQLELLDGSQTTVRTLQSSVYPGSCDQRLKVATVAAAVISALDSSQRKAAAVIGAQQSAGFNGTTFSLGLVSSTQSWFSRTQPGRESSETKCNGARSSGPALRLEQGGQLTVQSD